MARIRTIKPEFFTSEDIMDLSPVARLLYIALWCEADKEGRFAWKPKTFKVRYLPSDKCDIELVAATLLESGLVVVYGDGLAFIPSFKSHQHINPREKDSSFPAPTDEELTRHSRVSDASVTRREEGRKGREGNTRDAAPAKPRFDPIEELAARGVLPQTAEDWITLRKAKRAVVTLTVLQEIIAEADKAGMSLDRALAYSCRQGWQGFKASWVKDDPSASDKPAVKDWQ